MRYEVPSVGVFELDTVLLDLNGTLAIDGQVVEGVPERLKELGELGFSLLLLTGNTRGDADALADELGIDWVLAEDGTAKRQVAERLRPERAVAIGNGRIDLELMKRVKLRIVTLQAEGAYVETMLAADVIVPSILDALDLLMVPARLVSTLRR